MLLGEGRLEEAASTFKAALKSTRDLLQTNTVEASASPAVTGHDCVKPTRQLTPDVWISDSATPEGSTFLVYRAPDVICSTALTPSLNSMSASILFNLALTHHLKAMSRPSPAAAFATVTQLYEHTYRLVAQEPDADRFLALAILNNLAHVHYRMSNLADAERMCGLLWGAVLEAEKEDPGVEPLFEGFYTNVIHVTFRHSQSAAAA